MPLYAVSDLHLGDSSLARMFHDQSQGLRFAELCTNVARHDDGELILLGDIFDLTAAVPPARGVEGFYRALDVPYEARTAPALARTCAAIREHNPIALDALEALSQEAKVTFVPGNHDRHLLGVDGRAALDAAGLSQVAIEPMVTRKLGERVIVLQHGHEWDPSNATPTGGGEVMTGILHHAVVPFLRHLAPRTNVEIDADRIIALRPEERVVPVLERWLKPGMFERFVDAFVQILVENGYMSRTVSLFATPGRIRERLKDDDNLWERAGHVALEALEGRLSIPGRPPPPDVLVLGHTHVLDWAVQEGRPGVQRLYVNVGTWSARASDAAGPLDAMLPVFRIGIEMGRRLVATMRDLGGQGRLLQRFEVDR
ncbi:MAG: metallophosphoesterase [Myxococcales bacterium]